MVATCRSEIGVLPQLVLFTLLLPQDKAAPGPQLEQHAYSSQHASSGSRGGTPPPWPAHQVSEAVKPTEAITFRDGTIADVLVVGKPAFLSFTWYQISLHSS